MPSFALRQRLSHAGVDFLGELKVSALLGHLEQAAIEASWAAGLDPAWYAAAGRMWIVRRTRLERILPLGGGDVVEIRTEVVDWRRARSLRRYETWLVEPARGTRTATPVAPALAARATTDWVYCSIAGGRPASIPDEVVRAFSGDSPPGALPRPPAHDDGSGEAHVLWIAVRPSHLDHLAHANNAVWADILEDAARAARPGPDEDVAGNDRAHVGARISSLDVEYLGDAGPGDEIEIRTWTATGGDLAAGHADVVQRADVAGRPAVRARSTWSPARRSTILGGPPRSGSDA